MTLVGRAPSFRRFLALVERVAGGEAPALVIGETGTGKELTARAIHYGGVRAGRPFVPANCGAIPEAMIVSELFGHAKGAFTDAHDARPGLVTEAEGGTLFLDEIDTLSAAAQVALLRFLQDGRYRPLGGQRERAADVRIVAASNADLHGAVDAGRFRRDLLYRIDVLELRVPPLRERAEDIPLLAAHFLERLGDRYGKPGWRFGRRALAVLRAGAWPGNVRQLENLVHRALVLCDGPEIDDLGPALSPDWDAATPPTDAGGEPPVQGDFAAIGFGAAKARAVADFERRYLAWVMDEAGGNVTRAARLAGKERRALGRLLKKHGLAAATGRSACAG